MASPLFSKSARPTPNCECVSCGISFHTANPAQDACPRCLLTPKQRDINHRLLSAPKRHTLLYGGARSGKTVLFVRAIMMRAIHAPETRHAMLRLRANAARASLWLDTLPKVQRVFFPKFTLRDHRQDGYVEIVESGSQIWIAGTDDKERIEKILGQEFLTLYLNECSQIPYSTVLTVLTRLAQTHPEVMQKAFYDLNPVGTRHYTNMLFVQGRDPLTQIPILDAHQRQHSFINPKRSTSCCRKLGGRAIGYLVHDFANRVWRPCCVVAAYLRTRLVDRAQIAFRARHLANKRAAIALDPRLVINPQIGPRVARRTEHMGKSQDVVTSLTPPAADIFAGRAERAHKVRVGAAFATIRARRTWRQFRFFGHLGLSCCEGDFGGVVDHFFSRSGDDGAAGASSSSLSSG